MGKRPGVRRRGRGGMQFRAAATQKLKPAKYPSFSLDEERKGEIIDLVHESGRDVPLSKVRFEDGSISFIPAPLGTRVGQRISFGLNSEIIDGNVIISYSDILFEPLVVKRALESNHDISVVVDIDWRGYYVGRKDHPISEAENVIFNSNNEVEKIGKINTGKEEVHGEFIGMIKLTNRGAKIFKQHYHRLKKIYWNKPFQRAKTFQKAYLTDMMQELVDIGVKVHCIIIESGWKEIDTVEDYKKALDGFKRKLTKN